MPRPLTDATAADLTSFLTGDDLSGGTIRKHRGVILAALTWAYGQRLVSADTLLALRGAPCPATDRRTGPHPYTRRELREMREMWEALDRRWPRPFLVAARAGAERCDAVIADRRVKLNTCLAIRSVED